MKLMLQIAFGVFLGTLSAHGVLDSWHSYQNKKVQQAAEKIKAEQEKVRNQQGERVRNLLLQSRQNQVTDSTRPPLDYVPDDAQEK